MEIKTELINCSKCNIPFWITKGHNERLKMNHESFYCPLGHSQHYPQKTELDKAKEELNQAKKNEKQACTNADSAYLEVEELKAKLKKSKNKLPKRDKCGKFIKKKKETKS